MRNPANGVAPVRVAVVDDNAMYRRAIQSVLANYPDVQLVGVAEDAELGEYLLKKTMPDVVLVDVRMPGTDGIEFTRLLRQRFPGIEAVALTVSDDSEHLLEMLRAGAQGYVLKSSEPSDICLAILAAARGEAWLSPRMAARLVQEFTRLPASQIRNSVMNEYNLTSREQAVLRHLALGKTNSEIAESLVIAETTVKTHLKNILQKLHVRNRLEAALVALRGELESGNG